MEQRNSVRKRTRRFDKTDLLLNKWDSSSCVSMSRVGRRRVSMKASRSHRSRAPPHTPAPHLDGADDAMMGSLVALQLLPYVDRDRAYSWSLGAFDGADALDENVGG